MTKQRAETNVKYNKLLREMQRKRDAAGDKVTNLQGETIPFAANVKAGRCCCTCRKQGKQLGRQ
eukprot:6192328-Pleurochrysis_carterae.AAC.2